VLRRRYRRPRDIVYGAGALALLAWMIADGFHQPSVALFTIWACGGGLLLDALDKRSNRESNPR
jgi:hypothetical protein